MPSVVQQYSRHLCSIGWEFNLPWVYVHCSLSIYRSAKFGVAVFKASMLNCNRANLLWVYMHCSICI